MSQIEANGDSPFHPGEQSAQDRAGIRDKIEAIGRLHIRDHLPDQHRAFYAGLPFLLLGAVDADDRPWASIMPGSPGFISSPDNRTLDIAASIPTGDPLAQSLQPGSEVGVLGIQLETRRRNRASGTIAAVGADSFSIAIKQTFGNCSKYIQTRSVETMPASDARLSDPSITRSNRFDPATRALIEKSDTLFIASTYLDGPQRAARGADISHRGGKPGFVRVEDDHTFVVPDFSGNLHFNTIGNIIANPKAGFLFIDFDSGDLVYMTGQAAIMWSGPEVEAFAGAERLIRFQLEDVVRAQQSLPLRFRFGEYSPKLTGTGDWDRVAPARSATG